jgi:alpha-tubulin suppressor-like RCC1 family protein
MSFTPQLTELSPIPPISTISGGQTMCALATSGAVLCWGIASTELPGSYGADAGCSNYAAGSAGCVIAPAQVAGITATTLSNGGVNAALALTTNGVVVAWGNNTWGELGHPPGTLGDDTNDNNPTPTPVQGLP